MDILLPTHHYFSSLRPDYLLYDSLISQLNGTYGLQNLIEYQHSSSLLPPWVEGEDGERGKEDAEKERKRMIEIFKEVDEERKVFIYSKENPFFCCCHCLDFYRPVYSINHLLLLLFLIYFAFFYLFSFKHCSQLIEIERRQFFLIKKNFES